jgi:3-oxoacyl-[acyl-carrier-protein] synthase II
MGKRRVVVTGIGLVTPLGLGVEEFWEGLTQGHSAVRCVELFGDAEQRHLAASVPEFNIRDYVSNRRLLRMMCRSDRFGLAAAQMAVADAGEMEIDPTRKGCFIGTAKEMGPIEVLFDAMRASRDETGEMTARKLGADGFGEIPPLTLVNGLPNGCLFATSVIHDIRGANTSFMGSGEVGLVTIGAAYHAIGEGDADWVLAGGHDSGVDRWSYANFHRLGLLSQRTAEPASAVRPFDRRRDGFAPGEGACMVVLEERERALARGARVYAEIAGVGTTCDAGGQVTPRSDGSALARAVEHALEESGLGPESTGYVNAYASATPAGDRTELRALERVFGATRRRPLISGIKGAIGHLLAASGAVEFAATALAVRNQVVPPTLNLGEPDPECRFDCVPNEARDAVVAAALTISRGIGGQNAVVALKRAEST